MRFIFFFFSMLRRNMLMVKSTDFVRRLGADCAHVVRLRVVVLRSRVSRVVALFVGTRVESLGLSKLLTSCIWTTTGELFDLYKLFQLIFCIIQVCQVNARKVFEFFISSVLFRNWFKLFISYVLIFVLECALKLFELFLILRNLVFSFIPILF
jgi:hypothetical protein